MKRDFYKIVMLLLFVSGCNNLGADRLKEFEIFVNDVHKNKDIYTEEEWTKVDKRFEYFKSDDFIKPIIEGKSELKIEYENLKGKYLAYRYVTLPLKGLNKILKGIDSIKKSMENTLEGFKEGLKDLKIIE